MTKTVDPGVAPPSVEKQKRLKQLILSGEDLGTSDDVTPSLGQLPQDTIGQASIQQNLKRVIIRHNTYVLTLPAIDVSIAEHQIALRLPDNGVKFEPTQLNGEFTITYLNKDYSVAYLGGIFDFPGDSSWVIAFIRDNRPTSDD